jgi:hypothetical protein
MVDFLQNGFLFLPSGWGNVMGSGEKQQQIKRRSLIFISLDFLHRCQALSES